MNLIAHILLLQSTLSLPPLGYVRTPHGMASLYGIRFNFVLSDPLHDAVAAIRLQGVDIRKTVGEILIQSTVEDRIPAAGNTAFFSVDPESKTVFIWLPESSELIRWTRGEIYRLRLPLITAPTVGFSFIKSGRLQIAVRDDAGSKIWIHDARSFELLDSQSRNNIDAIASDSNGNEWTAFQHEVLCPGRQWRTNTPIDELQPLDQGWMLIRTLHGDWAARCDSDQLTAVPRP